MNSYLLHGNMQSETEADTLKSLIIVLLVILHSNSAIIRDFRVQTKVFTIYVGGLVIH